MVPGSAAADYGRIYEAILSLAWVGARHSGIRLGTSVIVVPQRNAVLLAKELATLDSLSGGRVTAGVGVGWNRTEFANLGAEERFQVRGAYLDETISLWRHLWSGSTEPFRGRFHTIEDFTFGPLPVQGGSLPIVVGGGSERALQRAGSVGDGYHASAVGPDKYGQRLVTVRAAATAAGRPMPSLSARVRVQFEGETSGYAMRGSPEEIAVDVRAFAGLGVTHLALAFATTDPVELVARAERFALDVAPLVEAA
jgi:probable F420-dependent oxidoreductase